MRNIVFPTPVGMDRMTRAAGYSPTRFPHTRGDGPCCVLMPVTGMWFSPHPWGWTGLYTLRVDGCTVFPTPVGMDRSGVRGFKDRHSFPHTRGDGPKLVFAISLFCPFSPHPWGWTAVGRLSAIRTLVFPTPVGMDRGHSDRNSGMVSFPHTRGDGPLIERGALKRTEFSPHPWGWTAPYPK